MTEHTQIFSYEEALDTFPAVRELTARAVHRIQALYGRVQSSEELARRGDELESAAKQVIEDWTAEITALGCVVKGLWLVDWDCGDGYYCWRYPEQSLGFFHSYEDGFKGRVPIV